MLKPTLALCLLSMIGCAAEPAGTPDAAVPDAGAPDAPDLPDGPDGGIDVPPFTNGVSTLSGAAEPGYVDGPRGEARFANPVNVAVAPDGMVYVADFDNGKLRAVDATGRTSTLIALQGFQRPFGMIFASDGTLYVSTDRDPQGVHGPMTGTIWKVDLGAKTATPIAARIGRPRGLAVLPSGQIVAADYMHHVVQLVDPVTGVVVPLAGAWDASGLVNGIGGAARFSSPYGVAVVNGEIVVADRGNHQLRKIGLDGRVSAFAGTGVAGYADGALATAQFNLPQGLAVTAGGDLYLTDLDNFRIRRISGGAVDTIAGNGSAGHADSDDRLAAQFFGLEGLSVAADGSMVFVADGGRGESVPYNRVRSIKLP